MEEYDEQMRLKYCDPIKNFPDKIDQLLEALDRVRLIDIHIKSHLVGYLDIHKPTKRKQPTFFV
jgi:hypothetical protein